MRSVVIALLVVAVAVPAAAQTPCLMAYFDGNFTQGAEDCPAAPVGTVLDTLYIVALNFNTFLKAIEFSVELPPELTYQAEVPVSLAFGNTQTGLALALPQPFDAFGPTELVRILFLWNCDNCGGHEDAQIIVQPHPGTGYLRAVRWPDDVLIDAVGMTSLVCQTVPVEDTTWGQLKALYSD